MFMGASHLQLPDVAPGEAALCWLLLGATHCKSQTLKKLKCCYETWPGVGTGALEAAAGY